MIASGVAERGDGAHRQHRLDRLAHGAAGAVGLLRLEGLGRHADHAAWRASGRGAASRSTRICPGYIETDINSDWFKTEGGQKQMKGFPRRRLMEPRIWTPPLLMLAGPPPAPSPAR